MISALYVEKGGCYFGLRQPPRENNNAQQQQHV